MSFTHLQKVTADVRAAPAKARTDLGASVVEYALLVSLIMVVALTAVTYFGAETGALTSSVSSELVHAQRAR